ncbi:MAG: D-alanyl-D-alanine carboxypeptidase family protein, partial [Exiguobacterium sp.]|nr:D-alanyl-D-alanine carboxypeptidase family protein [Exiguobacterium sp.]
MRYPSILMVCGALTFMLAGCTTNEQVEPKEPTTQSSTIDEPETEPHEPTSDREDETVTESPSEEGTSDETEQPAEPVEEPVAPSQPIE